MMKKNVFQTVYNILYDRAVFFGLLSKLWGIGAGIVTVLIISTRFTPDIQGYYYTFASILALQVLVELGLGIVIVQFVSHEWAYLDIDKTGDILGDENALSRLISIAGIAVKWYTAGGLIIASGLSIGGYIFFSSSSKEHVDWLFPWISLCLLAGTNILLVPAWSFLEGCNQVATLYTYKFIQGVITSLSMWAAILLGAGLWMPSISTLMVLISAAIFIRFKYWRFFKTLLFHCPEGPRVNWRESILPFQWRTALSWLSGYFIFSLFVPVLFKYQGPVIAGKMGMTWSLVNIVSVATAYFYPKVPQLGMMIAQKKYIELEKYFYLITRNYMFFVILIVIGITTGVSLCWMIKIPLATRILSPLPTLLFLLAAIVNVVSFPFSYYMFAQKKNPLTMIAIMNAVLTAISTIYFGKNYSVVEVAMGFLIIQLIIIPFIFMKWQKCRAGRDDLAVVPGTS